MNRVPLALMVGLWKTVFLVWSAVTSVVHGAETRKIVLCLKGKSFETGVVLGHSATQVQV
jgi:hypothetical protein